MVYEVEFLAGTTEYDYDINAVTGAVVKAEKDSNHFTAGASSTPSPSVTSSVSGGISTPAPSPGNPSSGVISESEAKAAAFQHAGVDENSVSGYWSKMDSDDGRLKYEIEFYVGNVEYDYDIDASTGAVLKAEQSHHGGNQVGNQGGNQGGASVTIGEVDAKVAALKHAGVNESSVTGYRYELDYDDGLQKYEIEFFADGVEYDYEIDAATGAVLKAERSQQPGTAHSGSGAVAVSEDEAKATALKHAGLSESNISRYKIQLDQDDGRMVYEIEFHAGQTEYDYEIDASTGVVLKADIDRDD